MPSRTKSLRLEPTQITGFKGGSSVMPHAFQKKSKTGRATSLRDMQLIRQRLREAQQIAPGSQS